MQTELLSRDEPTYESTSFPDPREFQKTAHEKLRDGRRAGHRCQMVMAPTGAGKSYLGMRIIHEALRRGKKAIFMCDRTTLINQTSAVADEYGLSAHGVIQSDHWRTDSQSPFQIASCQTLANRGWPSADVIVIDEAHTQYKAWTEHVQDCGASIIGLSATPFSAGLGKIFTNLVNAATMHELTESEVLVPLRVFSGTKIDMQGAKTKIGGEWADRAVEERGMEIIGDVVSEWIRRAENRKTIVFGATIAHCEEMCRKFNDAGVMAAVFTKDTQPTDRAMLLNEFNKPDSIVRVLISVEALAKGFDVKDVGCICDVRPLRKSLSTAIQMWGRGLRSSPATGKKDCYLLDFSGNIIRFAEDFSDIFYNGMDCLDTGEKLDKVVRKDNEEKEGAACPKCGFKPFAKRCISCGHEHVKQSGVIAQAGEMKEIVIGKTKYADDAFHLWQQAVTYARGNGAPEKQKGRAAHIYKSITGQWPPAKYTFDATPNAPISQAVLNKIRSCNIAFSKGRKNEFKAAA